MSCLNDSPPSFASRSGTRHTDASTTPEFVRQRFAMTQDPSESRSPRTPVHPPMGPYGPTGTEEIGATLQICPMRASNFDLIDEFHDLKPRAVFFVEPTARDRNPLHDTIYVNPHDQRHVLGSLLRATLPWPSRILRIWRNRRVLLCDTMLFEAVISLFGRCARGVSLLLGG